jgi:hypothetical protein
VGIGAASGGQDYTPASFASPHLSTEPRPGVEDPQVHQISKLLTSPHVDPIMVGIAHTTALLYDARELQTSNLESYPDLQMSGRRSGDKLTDHWLLVTQETSARSQSLTIQRWSPLFRSLVKNLSDHMSLSMTLDPASNSIRTRDNYLDL